MEDELDPDYIVFGIRIIKFIGVMHFSKLLIKLGKPKPEGRGTGRDGEGTCWVIFKGVRVVFVVKVLS